MDSTIRVKTVRLRCSRVLLRSRRAISDSAAARNRAHSRTYNSWHTFFYSLCVLFRLAYDGWQGRRRIAAVCTSWL